MDGALADLLRKLAAEYESPAFLKGDPSCFMHEVEGAINQEATAFVASSLSFGSRKQFLPKIAHIIKCACGDVHAWLVDGRYTHDLPDCNSTFYRFYTCGIFRAFLDKYSSLLRTYGTLGEYLRSKGVATGEAAIREICAALAVESPSSPIPHGLPSACKRVAMFLRWMVRDNSPVDLGLWSGFIDKSTLIMPLDVHVMAESRKLGLIQSKCASFATAKKLSAVMSDIFPGDPLKGDFALFGLGVDDNRKSNNVVGYGS